MKTVNTVKTQTVVKQIIADILEVTCASCTVSYDTDGFAKITANNGYLVPDSKYGCTAANLDLAIDDHYYALRSSGNCCTQRIRATVIVAVFN